MTHMCLDDVVCVRDADCLRRQRDDSPLYLFETGMDDDGHLRNLLDDFEIPDLFPDDWC